MKRLLSLCCALLLLGAACLPIRAEARADARADDRADTHVDQPQLSVSAAAAILVEPVTGAVLYGKNADERLPMASTTVMSLS